MQVPPDAVEPLFKQIVNQFVHDRSRTEVSINRYFFVILLSQLLYFIKLNPYMAFPLQSIAVGLNVVREICLRIPLVSPFILFSRVFMWFRRNNRLSVPGALMVSYKMQIYLFL